MHNIKLIKNAKIKEIVISVHNEEDLKYQEIVVGRGQPS